MHFSKLKHEFISKQIDNTNDLIIKEFNMSLD